MPKQKGFTILNFFLESLANTFINVTPAIHFKARFGKKRALYITIRFRWSIIYSYSSFSCQVKITID